MDNDNNYKNLANIDFSYNPFDENIKQFIIKNNLIKAISIKDFSEENQLDLFHNFKSISVYFDKQNIFIDYLNKNFKEFKNLSLIETKQTIYQYAQVRQLLYSIVNLKNNVRILKIQIKKNGYETNEDNKLISACSKLVEGLKVIE
jgi:hypothetical protein